jgi:6-phosphogluconolactonase/glucosamine-6-phosphate isomerase/deaminase
MNTVSNIPYLAKYYIQQNNIKKKITKIIQFDESTMESEEYVEKENKVERVTDIIVGGSS